MLSPHRHQQGRGDIAEIEPVGSIGIDRNLDNVTIADSDGGTLRYDLAGATEVKARCRETKRHFRRNDARIRRVVYGKYGRIQRNRVGSILHNVSASIFRRAKEKRLGIVMENIRGIRRLYRKGNGQGTNYRARLNSWSFHELQRQIEYKARWEGIPVAYVAARGTSVNCSICGSRTYPNERRTLHCSRCDISIDRDVTAARNILAKGGGGRDWQGRGWSQRGGSASLPDFSGWYTDSSRPSREASHPAGC